MIQSALYFTVTCEVVLQPKSCSCVYTCSAMNTSLTWRYNDSSGTLEETYYGNNSEYAPRMQGCYIFELIENTKQQTGLIYNITSTLTINSSCSNEMLNNTTVRCLTGENDVEEVSVCLPGRK